MYLVALYRIWCSYHIYVRKAIRFKILWHHSEPFGSSLGHSSYFFKGVRPSFNGLTCCPHLYRMLGFDHFCINILFPTRWSLYFLDMVAHVKTGTYPFQVTLHDTHVMLFEVIQSHVFLFKSLIMQSYLQMQFSLMDKLHKQEFASLLTNVPSNVMWTHLCSCVGPVARAWLLACFSTLSLCLSSTHFLIALCIRFNISHPTILHLSQCQCDLTIDDLGIHLLCCSCGNEHITTHHTFQNAITTIALETGTHIQKEVSHLFPPPHMKTSGYCNHHK